MFSKRTIFSFSMLAFALMLIIGVTSCEKDITLSLPTAPEKIVVEGYIEQDSFPYVFLSKSFPYFAKITDETLGELLVTDAIVTIDDGTTIDTLYPTLDYSLMIPFVYKGKIMRGEVGKTYKLKIDLDTALITAVTTIPAPIPLDSVWFKVEEFTDSLGFAWAHLTDPDTLGNYYRWFAKRIGKDDYFVPPFNSMFEDKFINGKSFDMGYDRGNPPNAEEKEDEKGESGYFKVGDVIAVKFCSVDRAFFEFLRTYETEVGSNGNPFASPTIIQSNIKGPGLGIWGGYGASFDTIYAEQ